MAQPDWNGANHGAMAKWREEFPQGNCERSVVRKDAERQGSHKANGVIRLCGIKEGGRMPCAAASAFFLIRW